MTGARRRRARRTRRQPAPHDYPALGIANVTVAAFHAGGASLKVAVLRALSRLIALIERCAAYARGARRSERASAEMASV